jgi:hypothetical protein
MLNLLFSPSGCLGGCSMTPHENVLRLIGVCIEQEPLLLIMEYCSNRSLKLLVAIESKSSSTPLSFTIFAH